MFSYISSLTENTPANTGGEKLEIGIIPKEKDESEIVLQDDIESDVVTTKKLSELNARLSEFLPKANGNTSKTSDNGDNASSVNGGNSRSSSISRRSTLSTVKDKDRNGMSRRQEAALKREARVKEEEKNLTFKPQLVTTKRTEPQEDADKSATAVENTANVTLSRFDILYNEARKRQQELKDKKPNDYSFQPKISPRARSKERPTKLEDSIHRLYNGVGSGRKTDGQKDPSIGNFQPKITKRAKSIERSDATSFEDRLYGRAQQQQEKQYHLKALLDKKATEECTFIPRTNSKRSGSAERKAPEEIAERMQRYLDERRRKIEEAKRLKDEQESSTTTFKPQLVATKKVVRDADVDVFTRLSINSTDKEPATMSEDECTFKPQINQRRSLSPHTTVTSEYSTVYDRLYKIGEQRKKELEIEREMARQEEEKELTFVPQIVSKPIETKDREPVFERLASSRQYVQEILTQIKSEYELAECTFTPEINPVNPQTANRVNQRSSTPVHLRLSADGERLKEVLKQREDLNREKEMEGCTFAPVVKPTSFSNLVAPAEKDVFKRLTSTSLNGSFNGSLNLDTQSTGSRDRPPAPPPTVPRGKKESSIQPPIRSPSASKKPSGSSSVTPGSDSKKSKSRSASPSASSSAQKNKDLNGSLLDSLIKVSQADLPNTSPNSEEENTADLSNISHGEGRVTA